MAVSGYLAVLAAVGCSARAEEPTLDVAFPFDAPALTVRSRSAMPDIPPAPVTLPLLVADGKHWRLVTSHGPVHVWIPRGYNPRRAQTIVYVHGYYIHVDDAWQQHRLPEQFAASTINAMFIACEAPAGVSEGVYWESINALLAEVGRGIGQKQAKRRIVAIGHSGAFRTLLGWLDEPELRTVVLLDAAYGEIESYRAWITASERHRLIDIAEDTQPWTEALHKTLPESVVLEDFPSVEEGIPKSAARARILYIKSKLGHFGLVTGGTAMPMILRTLRARRLLDVPLDEILGK
ncbi:MAG: hypothetical protein ABI867_08740 [Kofleriaceae bacterium]